jgi:hypothetical protein
MTQYINVETTAPMAPPIIITDIKEFTSEGRDSLILFMTRKLEIRAINERASIISTGFLKLTSFFNFSLKNKLGLNNKVFISFPLNFKLHSTNFT